MPNNEGVVSIVGAGPGEFELLTLKAYQTINSADIIFYDNLVSDEIVKSFPQKTRTFFVGKSKKNHSVPQKKINQLLIQYANKGFRVCRLKGGDPFVFGRGSEEMLELIKSNIRVEVVPGITAASGCSSYAGLPLTHRGLSQGCTFVTGHAAKDLNLNWQALANLNHTLVFYMGLSQIGKIAHQLTASELSPDTPAAVIENGSTQYQRVFVGTVNTLEKIAFENDVQSPALIIIGKTVELRSQLDWFSSISADTSLRQTA